MPGSAISDSHWMLLDTPGEQRPFAPQHGGEAVRRAARGVHLEPRARTPPLPPPCRLAWSSTLTPLSLSVLIGKTRTLGFSTGFLQCSHWGSRGKPMLTLHCRHGNARGGSLYSQSPRSRSPAGPRGRRQAGGKGMMGKRSKSLCRGLHRQEAGRAGGGARGLPLAVCYLALG